MKRLICLLLCFTIGVVCTGCFNNNGYDNTTTTTTEASTTEKSSEILSVTENTTESETSSTLTTEKSTQSQSDSQINEKDSTTTTKKSQSNSLISDEDLEKIENSNAEVFFTDNPDNKYIVAISEKYGSKKENLVALIKVNAEFPTVTILEFSGKTDKNGELVMTYDEFKFIYEINEEDNTIIKASKNGLNNDGLSFVEAKVYVLLAKEYLIPELPDLKANKQYSE